MIDVFAYLVYFYTFFYDFYNNSGLMQRRFNFICFNININSFRRIIYSDHDKSIEIKNSINSHEY